MAKFTKHTETWLGETPAELGRLGGLKGGKIGGRSRSKAKVAAARLNGKHGGRPATWTLAERLLRRRLSESELRTVKRAYNNDSVGGWFRTERDLLEAFFGAARGISHYQQIRMKQRVGRDLFATIDSKHFRRRTGRMPADVRYVVDKFRLMSRHALAVHSPK